MRSGWARVLLGAALVTFSLTWRAEAQDYPNRRITFVVPFSAGGVTDVLARLVASGLQERSGQAVMVENRPGAVGAYEAVARSTPDGYTLMFAANGLTIYAGLNPEAKFDPRRDLTALGRVANQPMIIVGRANLAESSLPAVIAAAKANPNKYSYASPGHGTPMHLGAELLGSEVGARFVHVPYRGAVPAMTDIMSGQVDIYYGTETSAGPYIQAGKMKALAVTAPKRLADYPDVPTLAELGLGSASVDIWYGLFGPPGIEAGIVQRIEKLLSEVTTSEDFKTRIGKMQLAPWTGGASDLKADLEREVPMWADIARKAGITEKK